MQDLTGKWHCNGDEMDYYFTQIGNTLYSMGIGHDCYNVGLGTINPDDATFIFQWVDTPNSKGMGNKGICFFDASESNLITKKDGSPSFEIGTLVKVS